MEIPDDDSVNQGKLLEKVHLIWKYKGETTKDVDWFKRRKNSLSELQAKSLKQKREDLRPLGVANMPWDFGYSPPF